MNPELNLVPRCVVSAAVVGAAGVFEDDEWYAGLSNSPRVCSIFELVSIGVVVQVLADVTIDTSVSTMSISYIAILAAVPNN